jgi:type II secretory pathway component GspD/PulD (secretin)
MLPPLARTTALLAAGLLAAAANAQCPSSSARCPAAGCATAGRGKMVTTSYPVAELVVSAPNTGKKGETGKTHEEDLIRSIQHTLSPQTWAENGGSGTIEYFPTTMALVVNQTPDVQEQIADLLSKLRREQNTEVALEVRLITVRDECFERVGVDFNNAPVACPQSANLPPLCPAGCVNDSTPAAAPAGGPNAGPVFLSDRQVFKFLDGVQGDQRSNIMQAPKVTLLNGQIGNVDCTDKQKFVTGLEVVQRDGQAVAVPKTEEVVTGFHMTACPVVSADRRFVTVNLDVNQTDLASAAVPLCPVTVQIKDDQGKPQPFTQLLQQPKVNTLRIQKTLTIPDGGTVLLGGLKKVVEARNEYGPPVLSRVPYVNRLFKNVGYGREAQTVYVLVTPRVIVNEEEVQQAPPAAHCENKPCCPTAPQACATEEAETVPAPCHGQAKAITELLKAYDEACAAGRTQEAAKLAQAALVLDPTCFAKSRGR